MTTPIHNYSSIRTLSPSYHKAEWALKVPRTVETKVGLEFHTVQQGEAGRWPMQVEYICCQGKGPTKGTSAKAD